MIFCQKVIYLLKNFNEKGWGLFDLQTLAVKINLMDGVYSEVKTEPKNKDESVFTQILAKASDDSTLLEKTEILIKEVKMMSLSL